MSEKIYGVSEINIHIADIFEEDKLLSSITIEGEISSFRIWPSGHVYFTIKDAKSKLDGIMYSSRVASGLKLRPQIGDKVRIKGHIEVYVKDGSYKLYADRIEKAGDGELYAKYLEMKTRLEEMGMFDQQYKKPIPKYVKTIGVVTASSGAVIHDIIRTSKEINPFVEIILYPSMVQGDAAPPQLIRGLKTLDEMGLDVIIIGRGGGSVEDLWCFNDENLAKAIFDAKTPVVSAVGHETDFSITDFVADATAATPTMAAEYVNFDFYGLLEELKDSYKDISSLMNENIKSKREKLTNYRNIFEAHSPVSRLNQDRLRLETVLNQLNNRMERIISGTRTELLDYERSLSSSINDKLTVGKHKLSMYTTAIEGLSPLKRIASGFAYVSGETGRVSSAKQVKSGDSMTTWFADGKIESKVVTVTEMDKPWEKK